MRTEVNGAERYEGSDGVIVGVRRGVSGMVDEVRSAGGEI